MKKLVAIFLVAILVISVTIPHVFSDNEKNNNNNDANNQENTGSNHEKDNKDNDKIHFQFSNATNVHFTLPNGTVLTFGFSNGTNIGQPISGFVHQMNDIFKQQDNQIKQTIKDCREKAREASSPAERKDIMNQCKVKLKEIKQQFKNEQKQFQVDFKQLREMVIGNNQQVHEKPHAHGSQEIQNKTMGKQKGLEQKLHQRPVGKNHEHDKQG